MKIILLLAALLMVGCTESEQPEKEIQVILSCEGFPEPMIVKQAYTTSAGTCATLLTGEYVEYSNAVPCMVVKQEVK